MGSFCTDKDGHGYLNGDLHLCSGGRILVGGVPLKTGSDPLYEIYSCVLNQAGTDAPVATILQDTTTGVDWSYVEGGVYQAVIDGGFDPLKTQLFIGAPHVGYLSIGTSFDGAGRLRLEIGVVDSVGHLNTVDDCVVNLSFELRIYP